MPAELYETILWFFLLLFVFFYKSSFTSVDDVPEMFCLLQNFNRLSITMVVSS